MGHRWVGAPCGRQGGPSTATRASLHHALLPLQTATDEEAAMVLEQKNRQQVNHGIHMGGGICHGARAEEPPAGEPRVGRGADRRRSKAQGGQGTSPAFRERAVEVCTAVVLPPSLVQWHWYSGPGTVALAAMLATHQSKLGCGAGHAWPCQLGCGAGVCGHASRGRRLGHQPCPCGPRGATTRGRGRARSRLSVRATAPASITVRATTTTPLRASAPLP